MTSPADKPVRLHGIPNCDTVKRARAWLAGRDIAVEFVDFRKQGVPAALDGWWRRWASPRC